MSVNKVILLGNVGNAPEIKDVKGIKVASISLATTDKGYQKSDGTIIPKRTEWHNIVAWGKLSEVIERYVSKGSKIYIEGSIHTRSYDKDKIKMYITEIVVEKLELIGKPQQASAPSAPSAPVPQETLPPYSNGNLLF